MEKGYGISAFVLDEISRLLCRRKIQRPRVFPLRLEYVAWTPQNKYKQPLAKDLLC